MACRFHFVGLLTLKDGSLFPAKEADWRAQLDV